MSNDLTDRLAEALIDARWDPPEAREIARDLTPAVQEMSISAGGGDPEAMVRPLRVWLTHAGFGTTRLDAARSALDDFVTAVTP